MRVRPRGTACRSQPAEHHPIKRPSNVSSKHFLFSVDAFSIVYDRLTVCSQLLLCTLYERCNAPMVFYDVMGVL